MKAHDVFWKLETLSDRQLLEQLGSVLGSSRRLMAELLAHLVEVEERRLHLVAACSSMFAYCLKLGMTEDEAYRRIEAARLARRYSAIFPLLATGQLTISALALLKHHLSDDNHLELLAAVAGKSVVQTRELIAARFPRPDVSSSVRKLPERRAVMQPTLPMSTPTEPPSGGTVRRTVGTEPCASETESCFTSSVTGSIEAARPGAAWAVGGSMSVAPAIKSTPGMNPETPAPPVHPERGAPAPPSSRIEPLSAHRYKVQFTAGAELARKLELARDLMRHAHPGGELGPIVERALDLLIESLMRRRFGKKASPKPTSGCASRTDPEQLGKVVGDPSTMRCTARPPPRQRSLPSSPPPRRSLMPRRITPRPTTPARSLSQTSVVQRSVPWGSVPQPRLRQRPLRQRPLRQASRVTIVASSRAPPSRLIFLALPAGSWSSATVWAAAGLTSVGCAATPARGSSTIIGAHERKAAARSPTTCDFFVELIAVSPRSESTDASTSSTPSPSEDATGRRTRYDG